MFICMVKTLLHLQLVLRWSCFQLVICCMSCSWTLLMWNTTCETQHVKQKQRILKGLQCFAIACHQRHYSSLSQGFICAVLSKCKMLKKNSKFKIWSLSADMLHQSGTMSGAAFRMAGYWPETQACKCFKSSSECRGWSQALCWYQGWFEVLCCWWWCCCLCWPWAAKSLCIVLGMTQGARGLQSVSAGPPGWTYGNKLPWPCRKAVRVRTLSLLLLSIITAA